MPFAGFWSPSRVLRFRGRDFVGKLPFPDLKKQALINQKVNAADQDPEFSQKIRESLAGFQE